MDILEPVETDGSGTPTPNGLLVDDNSAHSLVREVNTPGMPVARDLTTESSRHKQPEHPGRRWMIHCAFGTQTDASLPNPGPTIFWVEDRLAGTLNLPSSMQVGLLALARDPDLPDESRLCALRILATFFVRPVAPQRWRFVLPQVLLRAELESLSIQNVVQKAALTALGMPEFPVGTPDRSFEATLRQAVNQAATEDLLDGIPKHQGREQPLDNDEEFDGGIDIESDVLSRQFGHALIELARLSPAEHEVIQKIVAGWEVGEIAQATGRATSTIRNQLANARRKLERAMNLAA